eukprot:m.77411 g.77411  ORF g.77411 m.77411 type:complete len:454 (+) comp13213_c0_seq3:126-1487(+)
MAGAGEEPLDICRRLFQAGVEAVQPIPLLQRALKTHENKCSVLNSDGTESFSFDINHNIHVVAFGKAALGMMEGAFAVLNEHIVEAFASCPQDLQGTAHFTSPCLHVFYGAAHNLPDEHAAEAAATILAAVKALAPTDVLLVLVSGGGSALLPLPADGITIADKAAASRALASHGASIQQLNIVRKHLSKVKGGRLAAASPCPVFTLVLSDVLGDPVDIIASGPTVADSSTFADCISICNGLNAWSSLPESVRAHLERGVRGEVPETPKSIKGAQLAIVGSNTVALQAMVACGTALGISTHMLSAHVCGPASEAASWLVQQIDTVTAKGDTLLVAGGETVVQVSGHGRGGRCQHMALVIATLLAKRALSSSHEHVTVLCAGSDGQDGPTSAAGAVVDATTVAKAAVMGLDPETFLRECDSNTFFSRVGGLVQPGLTGTNVMDLFVLFIRRPPL